MKSSEKSKSAKKKQTASKSKNDSGLKSNSKPPLPNTQTAAEAPTHLTPQDISLLAEITTARVTQLKKEGVLKVDSTGEYPFVKTVKALIMYYKQMNTGSAVNRYKAAKAELSEMKVKEAKKQLLRREAVEFGLNKVCSIVTERLNDMPEVLAVLVAGKTVEEAAESIRSYSAKILNDLSANIKSEFGTV